MKYREIHYMSGHATIFDIGSDNYNRLVKPDEGYLFIPGVSGGYSMVWMAEAETEEQKTWNMFTDEDAIELFYKEVDRACDERIRQVRTFFNRIKCADIEIKEHR